MQKTWRMRVKIMLIVRMTLTFAVISCSLQSASAQSRTQNGATLGGVAGAVIGGIIGKQNDETPEGALIGGAVGAITGGLIGRAQDNDLQRQRYYQEQAYAQQQQQVYAQQQAIANAGVSLTDVVNMSRTGISESLIMTHLQTKGVQRRLEVSDIIALHQQGISDTLITAFQAAPLATQVSAAYQPTYQQQPVIHQPTVIVREQPVFYRSPVVVQEYYQPYPVHRHYHSGHRAGTSIRLGF
jgi:outer membrane lipoprotein SlyB